MAWVGSSIASLISGLESRIVFGNPVTRSRPRTSAEGSSAYGQAEPTASLSCSAVRSPMSTLYSFLTQSMIAVSNSSPPTLIDLETTIPPSEMTATSVVPPPMSTTIDPAGSPIGRPEPMAAAMGSSMV